MMKRLTMLCVFIFLSGIPEATLADDTFCVGVLLPGRYDNIVVPPAAVCEMEAAVVHGTIKVLENAVLGASNLTVHGNIIGDKASALQVNGSIIDGNVEMTEGGRVVTFFQVILCDNTLTNGSMKVEKTHGSIALGPVPTRPGITALCRGKGNTLVKGNIVVQENFITPGLRQGLDVRFNDVAGNLQVFKNIGGGEKFVQNNVVQQNVQCKENDPPFVGGPNAARKTEDQCF